MNIFSQSWQGLNLTPGQRAFLKLFEGWLFTAIGTGIAVAYQLLATGSQDFGKIELAAGGAAALTLINAIKKFLSAQTDLPLPVASLATQATETAIQEVQKIAPQPPVIIHNNMPATPEPRIIQLTTPPAPAPQPPPVPQFKTPLPVPITAASLGTGIVNAFSAADINTNVMPAVTPMANGRDWTGLEIPAVQP